MSTPSSPDQSQRLYSTAIAELALERAARLQALASEQDSALRDAESSEGSECAREPEGFARAELLAAARGAGIDPAFVEVALAEVEGGAIEVDDRLRGRGPGQAQLTRWLGVTRRNLMITRRFDARPEQVWSVLLSLTREPMSGLELVRVLGGHPAAGGIAVFQARPLQQVAHLGGYSTMAYRLQQLELESVQVTLEPEGEGTRLRVVGDLEPGMGKNVKVARILSFMMGASFAACAGVVGLTTGIGVAIAAGAVGMSGGFGSMAALWRWTYPRALRALEDELGTLFDKLASELMLGSDTSPGSGPNLALVAS